MTQFFLRQNSSPKATVKLKKMLSSFTKNHFKLGAIIVFAIFILKNDLSFQLNFNTAKNQVLASKSIEEFSLINPISHFFNKKEERPTKSKTTKTMNDDNLSNDYSNMTYDSKNVSKLTNAPAEKIKKQKQLCQAICSCSPI